MPDYNVDFNDLEQCKLPRWILDCTLKALKGFIFTYHQCRKWNIEATAARTCYLDWAGETTSRCWIHQRGSCFTPNTPLCHLHNKRFDLYFYFFHGWLMTSCSSKFTSTQKDCHVEQRLSRFPWKRQAITHEKEPRLVSPGGTKVLDGHSWQSSPTRPGSVSPDLHLRLLHDCQWRLLECIPIWRETEKTLFLGPLPLQPPASTL